MVKEYKNYCKKCKIRAISFTSLGRAYPTHCKRCGTKLIKYKTPIIVRIAAKLESLSMICIIIVLLIILLPYLIFHLIFRLLLGEICPNPLSDRAIRRKNRKRIKNRTDKVMNSPYGPEIIK